MHIQGRIQKYDLGSVKWWGLVPSPSLPLEVGPFKMQLGGLGSAVSSASGIWGGAPAEIEFDTF